MSTKPIASRCAAMRAAVERAATTTSVAIGLLVVVAARSSAPSIARRRDVLGLVLVAASVPFWLRTSWSHYFVHLPIAQTLLAGAFAERGRPRDLLAVGVLVAPSVYLSSIPGLFATEGWWYYANAGSLFFSNLLVLLGAAAFLVDAHLRDGAPIVAPVLAPLRSWLRTAGGRRATEG